MRLHPVDGRPIQRPNTQFSTGLFCYFEDRMRGRIETSLGNQAYRQLKFPDESGEVALDVYGVVRLVWHFSRPLEFYETD